MYFTDIKLEKKEMEKKTTDIHTGLSRKLSVFLFNKIFDRYPDDVIRAVKTIDQGQRREIRAENLTNWYMKTSMENPDQLPKLSENQIHELQSVWKQLYDLGVIKHEWYELYIAKLGKFNPEYIGSDLHYYYTEWLKIDYDYLRAFLDKNYIDLILKGVKQPKVIVRKIRGYYLDHDFNKITLDDAINIIYDIREKGAVIKISRESSGGKGLTFIGKDTSREYIKDHLTSGSDFAVQEVIRQHPDMAAMNQSSINTVRILSIMVDGQSIPMSAVVRIGKEGSRVDNFSSGGMSCGINPDGSLKEVGFNSKGEKSTVHSNGFIFKNGKVPNFEKIVDLTKRLHYYVPMFGVVSWDIAIDETGEPVLIEYNVSQGQIDLHQYSNGPVYGKYRERIAEQILEYYKKRSATLDFNYEIRPDGVTISTVSRNIDKVKIPEEIDGNKVVKIGNSAFSGNENIKKVIIDADLSEICYAAFYKCKNLQDVSFKGNVIKIGRSAFNCCESLQSIHLPESTKSIGIMAFRNCTALKEISIPASVSEIAADAFVLCPNVTIYCSKGSFAHSFAIEQKINFKLV